MVVTSISAALAIDSFRKRQYLLRYTLMCLVLSHEIIAAELTDIFYSITTVALFCSRRNSAQRWPTYRLHEYLCSQILVLAASSDK